MTTTPRKLCKLLGAIFVSDELHESTMVELDYFCLPMPSDADGDILEAPNAPRKPPTGPWRQPRLLRSTPKRLAF